MAKQPQQRQHESGQRQQDERVLHDRVWVKGTTQAVCAYRFAPPTEGDVVAPVTPIRSNNTNPAMSSYLSRKFPAGLRACMDDKSNKSIGCTAAHDQELMWVIDMKAVYGKDLLTGANLADVPEDSFKKMLQACVDPYNQSGGHLTSTIGMGFRFFSDVPTTGTTFS